MWLLGASLPEAFLSPGFTQEVAGLLFLIVSFHKGLAWKGLAPHQAEIGVSHTGRSGLLSESMC